MLLCRRIQYAVAEGDGEDRIGKSRPSHDDSARGEYSDIPRLRDDEVGLVVARETGRERMSQVIAKIDNLYTITEITPADKPAYVQHLAAKQIYDQTLNIPYPYAETDADWWINHVAEETKKQGRSVNWALRKNDGLLVGGIGFHGLELGKTHRAEIGYWLAKPFWGQGIMTKAVELVSDFAFKELGLVRITANVFLFNQGSSRVLEKAGFQLECILRKHYKKDDKIFDGKLYAKVKA